MLLICQGCWLVHASASVLAATPPRRNPQTRLRARPDGTTRRHSYGRGNDKDGLMNTTLTKPILLCYDGSEGARHAIETAGELFPERRAIVLYVWSPVATIFAAYGAAEIG